VGSGTRIVPAFLQHGVSAESDRKKLVFDLQLMIRVDPLKSGLLLSSTRPKRSSG
jgi:hypothetical protein